ncbi:MAG: CAP domain-containing protein [Polyangiaceae bacterium]|nr:CAP domain-containing protein [Polyangiaceae bacterium]
MSPSTRASRPSATGWRRVLVVLVALLAVATPSASAAPAGLGAMPPLVWRLSTSSPAPLVGDAASDALYKTCGAPDEGLRSVAMRNAGRLARGEPTLPSDELAFTLRAAGLPYVWPRAWTMRGPDLAPEKVSEELGKFVAKATTLGVRRCGVARLVSAEGTKIVSVVTADVLADLERLPTLARVGEWITLKGKMLVPASDAKVVLLGPRGQPRTVLASLSGDDVRATFSVDQPGEWVVQVLASASTEPRPVIEAHILAGTAAPLRFAETAAPGEEAAAGAADDKAALLAMINAARVSEGLKPLSTDGALDKVALIHSVRMRDLRTVGHELGDGALSDRLTDAGVVFHSRGENLAAAATVARAHRALWLSPSHRANLLDARFKRLGLGLTKSEDGRVWVTELFVD